MRVARIYDAETPIDRAWRMIGEAMERFTAAFVPVVEAALQTIRSIAMYWSREARRIWWIFHQHHYTRLLMEAKPSRSDGWVNPVSRSGRARRLIRKMI